MSEAAYRQKRLDAVVKHTEPIPSSLRLVVKGEDAWTIAVRRLDEQWTLR